jgi:hypothetical protein
LIGPARREIGTEPRIGLSLIQSRVSGLVALQAAFAWVRAPEEHRADASPHLGRRLTIAPTWGNPSPPAPFGDTLSVEDDLLA